MRKSGCLVFVAAVLMSARAEAVRPFVTDDARVVGKGRAQLETWFRREPDTFQHWAIGAFGPNDQLEVSMGFVHGMSRADSMAPYSYTLGGPVFQGKFLVHEFQPNGWPGLAAVIGGLAPAGTGELKPEGWAGFAYVCVTESLFDQDRLLLHLNFGFTGAAVEGRAASFTFGFGTELRVIGVFHLIAEVYSGDPYIGAIAGATQFGARFCFYDHFQLDVTGGLGVFQAEGVPPLPPFFGAGLRFVSHPLF